MPCDVCLAWALPRPLLQPSTLRDRLDALDRRYSSNAALEASASAEAKGSASEQVAGSAGAAEAPEAVVPALQVRTGREQLSPQRRRLDVAERLDSILAGLHQRLAGLEAEAEAEAAAPLGPAAEEEGEASWEADEQAAALAAAAEGAAPEQQPVASARGTGDDGGSEAPAATAAAAVASSTQTEPSAADEAAYFRAQPHRLEAAGPAAAGAGSSPLQLVPEVCVPVPLPLSFCTTAACIVHGASDRLHAWRRLHRLSDLPFPHPSCHRPSAWRAPTWQAICWGGPTACCRATSAARQPPEVSLEANAEGQLVI